LRIITESFRYAPYVCLLFPDLLLFVPRPVLAVSPGNDSGSEGALNSYASKNFLESFELGVLEESTPSPSEGTGSVNQPEARPSPSSNPSASRED